MSRAIRTASGSRVKGQGSRVKGQGSRVTPWHAVSESARTGPIQLHACRLPGKAALHTAAYGCAVRCLRDTRRVAAASTPVQPPSSASGSLIFPRVRSRCAETRYALTPSVHSGFFYWLAGGDWAVLSVSPVRGLTGGCTGSLWWGRSRSTTVRSMSTSPIILMPLIPDALVAGAYAGRIGRLPTGRKRWLTATT